MPKRLKRIGEAVRFIIGVPSYQRYCEHMAIRHPGAPLMDEATFFRARQEARYGGRSGGRCC